MVSGQEYVNVMEVMAVLVERVDPLREESGSSGGSEAAT